MDMKNYIPSSIRLYAKQFYNPSNINEGSFNDREINAMRAAYLNANQREEDTNNELLEMARRGEYVEDGAGWYTPAKQAQENFMRQRGSIQYGDYNGRENPVDSWEQGIGRSLNRVFRDDDFNMKNTLGRAKFYRDNNGNIIVKDTYDFDTTEEGTIPYKTLHTVAKYLGTPMDINVNLGNPKDWR